MKIKKYSEKMKVLLVITMVMALFSCQIEVEKETKHRPLAKFEPQDGKVILFAGQELESIGGLENYKDGYLDHFDKPGGFTMYSNLSPGDSSFGHVSKGLDGIFETADWGDSDSNMSLQLADPDFENMALAIGLSLVNHEQYVASGERDSLIVVMGNWLKSLGQRPVFLRIGYEFDGHSWNHYNRKLYLKSYRRIKTMLDSLNVSNVAYVWQSTGWASTPDILEEWYPGDDYVDWCAFSFFSQWRDQQMIEFARKKGKPVFIAEATPTISTHLTKFDGSTKKTDLSDEQQAQEAWDKWFVPLFNTIDENPDIVKAVSYINCNWKTHSMWINNPTFKGIDARLQINKDISDKWKSITTNDKYLKAHPELFRSLWRK